MAKKIWAGLDVGAETTSICVIDDVGEVLHEAVCCSALKSVHREISWLRRRRHARVGLEAGTGVHLARGLRTLGYSVDIYESRQLSRFLRARRNKTDAGDASGIAEAGRVGTSAVSKVHLKSLDCQLLQSRLTIRRHLIRERMAAMGLLCRQVELYGGKIVRSARGLRMREMVGAEIRNVFRTESPALAGDLHCLLSHCAEMVERQQALDRELSELALDNQICRRLMTIPGIGTIGALTFYAAVGDPHRFSRSADIGPYFGLAPAVHQSGLTVRRRGISKMGNGAMRSLLIQAAMTFTRSTGEDDSLRKWASTVEARRGRAKARVALARKLAVIMLAMWKTGQDYRHAPAAP
jgi:transposase